MGHEPFNSELSERLFDLAEVETHGVSYAALTRDGYIHLDGTTFTVDLLRKIIDLVEGDKENGYYSKI